MTEDRNWRIERKLDKALEMISELKEHVATDRADRQNQKQEIEEIKKDLAPIKKHVYMIQGGAKLIGAVSVLAGLLEVLFSMFGKNK